LPPAPAPPAGASPTVVSPNAYYPSAAPSAPPPAATPAVDARERQFEIMNEAVAALRQEVSRSYAQTEELTREADRLRALVTSLRRDLSKSRDENKALKSHIRELERRLHEVGTPAPEAEGSAMQPPRDAAAQRQAAPPPPAPAAPAIPPPQAPAEPAPGVAEGGTEEPAH
jgi:septal ring factor EnvC (AmiA/AmiB activator)